MKKILSEILDYHRRYFHLSLFITIALFLAVLIAFNYLFDFEDDYIDKLPQAKGWLVCSFTRAFLTW